MRRHSLPIGLLALACGLLAHAAPARAAAATWVSGTGTNAGNCPITAPCRTFRFAYGRTDAGGVINVLSSGSFGPLTITKSISIVADGVEALIRGAGSIGAAIEIQAGASDVVSLRGLTIDLHGTDNDGISFVSGAALHVHNSVIRNSRYGILFAPASGTSELHVTDLVIADTNADGIRFQPAVSGSALAILDRVRVENASDAGIVISGTVTTGSVAATVRDSVSAGAAGSGIVAQESGSGTTTVMTDRTASVNNGTGIYAIGAAATIRIGDSTVTGNGTGLNTGNSGTIASYATNKVNGNGTNGDPTSVIDMK